MRRLATTIVLALAVTTLPRAAVADHAWTSLTPMPEPREGACMGVIGNRIYVAFGFASGDTNDLRIYDIAKGTWSAGPSAPTAGRSEMYRGVVHDGTLYCVGGRSTPETWSFTPATGTWTQLASTPDTRVGATAAVQGNSIYLFGGRAGSVPCSGGTKSSVLRYDIDLDMWFPAGTMMVPRSDHTVAATQAFGRVIYIFGGCDGDSGLYYDTVEAYDTKTETSALLPSTLPGGPRANLAAAVGGPHTVRVTGGHNNSAAVAPNHVIFDVDTLTFSAGTPMPTAPCPQPNRSEHDVVYQGGRIYAVGGACPAFGFSIASLDELKLSP